ncbi:MAG: hypothetical protein GDYSWBUE_000842 [Candidatus Fervidibacterota bacterium]
MDTYQATCESGGAKLCPDGFMSAPINASLGLETESAMAGEGI